MPLYFNSWPGQSLTLLGCPVSLAGLATQTLHTTFQTAALKSGFFLSKILNTIANVIGNTRQQLLPSSRQIVVLMFKKFEAVGFGDHPPVDIGELET